jgi:hypothetical protein
VEVTKGAAERRLIPGIAVREAPGQPKGREPRRRTPKFNSERG